jgi:hypothetical protein
MTAIDQIPPLIKLCVPRKRHVCRVCGQWIPKGEPCERFAGVEQGEGWWTCHAHPECLDLTVTQKWDEGDWECAYWETETERPAERRKCFMCRKESTAWIALETRPRYVCSVECLRNYANAIDMT